MAENKDKAAAAAGATTSTTATIDEGSMPKNPNMELAQLLFTAQETKSAEARDKLLAHIKQDNMAPFYKYVCETLKEPVDAALLKQMEEANKAELERLEAKISASLAESELREGWLAKSEWLTRIGDKKAAEESFRVTYEKTVSLGQRMDLIFYLIRIGLFFGDADLVIRNLSKAEDLLKEGGDWDRRNRLKVYRGVHCLSVRNFKDAAALFLETVSTFTSTELMEYKDFVALTVLASVVALPRPELKKKVVEGPEIHEVLHDMPVIKEYLMSLYNCRYAQFFQSLAIVEGQMKASRLLMPHSRYYVREMRILAYTQLLESYRSVTLASMAQSFGVSVEFVDRDISRFVAAGRLNCKVDKVADLVETNRPDKKNAQYQSVIKQGDLLLNRIQKLSQFINV
eukprot:m.46344 g.46344  ORF g.46344 m.46344 type:complete len:400 (+) comp12527_c0_seq2:61-1260(+)